jgi:CcmD family protein
MSGLTGLALVTMIIWVALFGYVFSVDRKVSRLDHE